MSELETTPEQIIEQDITPEEIINNANTTIETFETKHEDCGNTVLLSTHTYDYAEIDWKDGIPPPINAANLNAMQQGIVDAQEQFDNAYTDLSLLRQDYHKFAKDSYDVTLQLNQKLDAVKDTLAATDTTLGAEIETLEGDLRNFHTAVYGNETLRQEGQLNAATGDIPYIGETLTSHAERLQTAEGKIGKIEGLTSAQTIMLSTHGQKISNLEKTCVTQTNRLNHIESRSKIVILEYQGNDISPFNDKGYSLDQFFTDLSTNSTFVCKAPHAFVSENLGSISAVSYLPCVYKESSENNYYLRFVETIPDPVKGLHIDRSISLTVEKVSDTWSCSWIETKEDSTQNNISFAPIVTEETPNVFIEKYLEDNYHSVILRYEYDNNIIHMNMTSKESDNLSCTFEGFYYSDTGVLNHIKIGWTDKKGYSDPDVTTLQQPEMNIFVAKYGVTTYQEIKKEIDNSIAVVCSCFGSIVPLCMDTMSDVSECYRFSAAFNDSTDMNNLKTIVLECSSDNTWSTRVREYIVSTEVIVPSESVDFQKLSYNFYDLRVLHNGIVYTPVVQDMITNELIFEGIIPEGNYLTYVRIGVSSGSEVEGTLTSSWRVISRHKITATKSVAEEKFEKTLVYGDPVEGDELLRLYNDPLTIVTLFGADNGDIHLNATFQLQNVEYSEESRLFIFNCIEHTSQEQIGYLYHVLISDTGSNITYSTVGKSHHISQFKILGGEETLQWSEGLYYSASLEYSLRTLYTLKDRVDTYIPTRVGDFKLSEESSTNSFKFILMSYPERYIIVHEKYDSASNSYTYMWRGNV